MTGAGRNARRRIGLTLAAVCAAVLALGWAAWEQSPEQRAARLDEDIAALERQARHEAASRLRELADCQANAIEFGADMHAACVEAFKVVDAVRQEDLARMRKRLEVLRVQRAALP